MNTNSSSSRFLAYIAVIVGALLLVSGIAAACGVLGAPLIFSRDVLGPLLGQTSGMFLGLVCGGLAVFHGLGALANRASPALKLPPFYFFWIAFAVVLGLGNVLLVFHIVEAFLFPFIFLLGAALPVFAVIAWSAPRLGSPITWRQASLALVAGSTLSITVAITLEIIFSVLIYFLVPPLGALGDLRSFGSGKFFTRAFFSPLVILFLIFTALQAPIPEEFAKGLSVALFGKRIQNERQALMIGLISGAGFAILENMLYEGLYAQRADWSWGGVTLLRGIGAVVHPLGTGLVAVGLFRARAGAVNELFKAGLAAIGLHTLWNGGFTAFVYLTGLEYYARRGATLSIYGMAIQIVLVIFLIALALGLWLILLRLTNNLAKGAATALAPTLISRRALAAWAFACVLILVPIGAALSAAWDSIVKILF